jgi:uncharacterized protein YchJ
MRPQSFTVKSEKRLNVLVSPTGVSQPHNPTSKDSKPAIFKFDAIWDTGASGTVITANVVAACDLKPISMVQVHTANGVRNSHAYLVNIYLPNHVIFSGIRVTEGEINGADILIGMDIIGSGDFAITNFNNRTTFTFRCPAMQEIDFVKTANIGHAMTGASRNEPCPCGSGKKYKKCCGRVV